jgi:hypothetical protein
MFLMAWAGFGFFSWTFVLCFSSLGLYGQAIMLVLGPFGLFYLTHLFSTAIRSEMFVIATVGEERALWINAENLGPRHTALYVWRSLVFVGHDHTGKWLSGAMKSLNLPNEIQELTGKGVAVVGSVAWSKMIKMMDSTLNGHQSAILTFSSWLWLYFALKRSGSYIIKTTMFYWFWSFAFFWHLDPGFVAKSAWVILRFLWGTYSMLCHGKVPDYFVWLTWRLTQFVVSFALMVEGLNSEIQRRHSFAFAKGSSRLVAHFRQFTMQAVAIIDDVALPSFVRRRFKPLITVQGLQDSLDIMKEVGWPINVKITEPVPLDVPGVSFKEWVLCGSDFQQGIHNLKSYVDKDLQALRATAIYRRSEEYASVDNELTATSRYFQNPSYSFPDLQLDDVWHVIKDIFAHSRLTPFNYIIAKWEKKYALGSFMTDPIRRMSKYKRKHFIRDIGGYGPFKRIWAYTFQIATQVLPVSAVSVKGEALPEKKWLADKVRSIVGSPITQYILSTIWNYGPNHRFSWESTPIKIGMPLNGYWMSNLWSRHARCQHHVEGDMTAFDSTVSGRIVDLIKAVRKKGFDLHKDRERISELIDINYEQINDQLLNTTSTGNIYRKGTGLTTGHSSTGMDNSLALVIIYLMAWKDLTGLSAKEFVFYNELSNYGDDHVLSFLSTKPAVWTPRNIQTAMARWGIVNRIVDKDSLDKVEFLSKHGKKATQNDLASLKKYNIPDVSYLIWHDKEKLVGKLTAKITNINPSYRVKRMLSYLSLTAHHEDVYNGIVKALTNSRSLASQIRNNKLKIPSYEKVMRDWYAPSSGQVSSDYMDNESEEFSNTGKLVEYGSVNLMDSFFGALSMVPDVLSPIVFNFGYSRALQVFLRRHLAWAIDFIVNANGISSPTVLQSYLMRTPYRMLDVSVHLPGTSRTNFTEQIVRHWLFLLYSKMRPISTYGAFLNFITARIASLQFILNGHMLYEQRQSEILIDLILVIALLDLVNLPDILSILKGIRLPDLQAFFELVEHYLLVFVWSSVPPNFRELTPSLKSLDGSKGFLLVEAPTGTGKSTALVQHIHNTIGHLCHRIIVIEPRVNLVTGLVKYMSDSFGLSVSGSTSGLQLDTSKKVFYMTPQALLGHLELLQNSNCVFVLDECHLQERFYKVIRFVLHKLKRRVIYMSATPTESQLKSAERVVHVPITSLWRVDVLKENLVVEDLTPPNLISKLVAKAVDDANSLPKGVRALFFLPTIASVEKAADLCLKTSLPIHSKVGTPETWSHQVYFSTSVCDVGITIPDVSYVWSSSVADFVNHVPVALSKSVEDQRKGRTGRTNNGTFKLVHLDIDYLPDGSRNTMGPDGLHSMLMDGLPIELALAYSKENTFSALGFEYDTLRSDTSKLEQAERGLCVFFRNFQPMFQGIVSASQANFGDFGPPFVVQESGAGNLSASAHAGAGLEAATLKLAHEVVEAALSGADPPFTSDNFLKLSNAAGPILAVRNLVSSLVSDLSSGVTSLLNPHNRVATGTVEEVYEAGKILNLLRGLDSIPTEE